MVTSTSSYYTSCRCCILIFTANDSISDEFLRSLFQFRRHRLVQDIQEKYKFSLETRTIISVLSSDSLIYLTIHGFADQARIIGLVILKINKQISFHITNFIITIDVLMMYTRQIDSFTFCLSYRFKKTYYTILLQRGSLRLLVE